VIHGSYGVLDVIRAASKQVSYRRYPVALLGITDVLQVVHKGGYQKLLIIWLRHGVLLKVRIQTITNTTCCIEEEVLLLMLTHFKFEFEFKL
jgi:hypothetical protein